MHEGGGDCVKYLKGGWDRKEGRENKNFKRGGGGKLGQGVGALKRGAGTSLRTMGKCCRLRLPADIKVHTNENYETCKQRHKLCHINKTRQSAAWKETCIKFLKYAECRFLADIWKIF